ncbi:histidinol dehydrogenase [uncultured Microbacterium sp.]|uniref:histidinol dehydrogenase n=1 Tax=uncultured Microbacterium sp. TaxID=191216 RepID=UPI0028D02383|nr:histidinol dehydrogenase [uncultured Microbacterium sp.]
MRIGWISRVLSWIAAALVGGVFGIAGTIGHSLTWGPIPVGLVVGAVACGAILIAIRSLTHDRGATLAAGLGMVGMLVLISGVGPGGSVVVQDTVSGRIWTYLVAGLVLLAVAWPSLSRLPVRAGASPQPAAPDAESVADAPSSPTRRSALGDRTGSES